MSESKIDRNIKRIERKRENEKQNGWVNKYNKIK